MAIAYGTVHRKMQNARPANEMHTYTPLLASTGSPLALFA